ncbi:MAG: hypothetical protein M3Y18_06485 [Candidatus Eremiobacteraeota bacterium]|nr:hypothetical protein [Candidatus Eremiobacteraeota bacterium]
MSSFRFASIAMLAGLALAGCSLKNTYEKEADKITRAVIADDTRAVAAELSPGLAAQVTAVKVAVLSDELKAAGEYRGIKENDQNCPPAKHCFDVRFSNHPYREVLAMDDRQKVSSWYVHEGAPGTAIGQ